MITETPVIYCLLSRRPKCILQLCSGKIIPKTSGSSFVGCGLLETKTIWGFCKGLYTSRYTNLIQEDKQMYNYL
jgi:hypothetical protein